MPAVARESTALATDTLPPIRQLVRAVLIASPVFHDLEADHRKELAGALVRLLHTAATLANEELESDRLTRGSRPQAVGDAASPGPLPAPPLAHAQATAGDEFSGVSASKIAGTTRAILNAVSFPRFVTELINGVFKAILDSTIQQMHSFIDLLNNVAAST